MARTVAQLAHQKKAFLEAFAEYGNVTTAAKVAGVPRRTIYNWQEHDEDFLLAYREAELQATETLEAEARRRAMDTSDTLLIFLLKARAPEKYRERQDVKHTIEGGDHADSVTPEEVQRFRAFALATRGGSSS